MYVLEKTGSDYDSLLNEALREMRLTVAEVNVRTEAAGKPGEGLIKLLIYPRKDRAAEAQALVEEILDHMGIFADITCEEDTQEIRLGVGGPNLGLIIGRRGTTLEAIQLLVSLIHNKQHSVRKDVVLNAEGYRERRVQELEQQVLKLLVDIEKSGRPSKLRLPQPADRKIVHQLVARKPGFSSRSVGNKFKDGVIIEFQPESEPEA